MATLDASAVARLLVELGRHTALAGNNYFRSRAYLRAADSLAALAEPLGRLIGENRLREVRGVGGTIADIVTKLHRTGTHPLLEKLRHETPGSVLEMLSIPGLKPDKISIIHKQLGITDLAGLEAAAREDRLKGVKGLGAALQRKILQGLAIREHAGNARHIHRAAELIATATGTLDQADPDLARVVPAGDLRRGSELVTDLAVVAEARRLDGKPKIVRSGDLAVHVTDAKRFGITLLLATGSRRHVEALEQRATEKGMALTSEGLRRGRKIVAAETEAGIYEALGLQFIEPELREGLDEIALAEASRIPDLVTRDDLHGVLHAHTEASDGVDTMEAMAQASRSGNPWRLDLDWRWLRRGLELGCKFSINPDAHSTGEIASSTRWGVAIARKSGMPADRVINTLDAGAFARWLRERKARPLHAGNRARQSV